MTFSPATYCSSRETRDETFTGALLLPGGGLWVGVVSSGHCSGEGGVSLAAPGDFFSGQGPVSLHAPTPCHVAAVLLEGAAAASFPAELHFFDGRSCPRGGELMSLLVSVGGSPTRRSALAYSLLCELHEAHAPGEALPALVNEAVDLMREEYATLYGVEELSEALGVSKCHLIRTFSTSVGLSPGQYLTEMRLAAAKELLLTGEYTLDTVAGLCGFSGANYFCRVFRRAEGCTPKEWSRRQSPRRRPSPPQVLL